MEEYISLQNIHVSGNMVEYKFTVSDKLSRFFTTRCFFIQYEQSVVDVPLSILSIPFVNCMAGLVWLSGAVLFVDEIDKTYYYAYKQLRSAYAELHNIVLKGKFVPSKIVKNEIEQSKEYLLLFGGGVDCHCSYLRNQDNVSGIVNIYGWLNSVTEVDKVDESDRNNALRFAREHGVQSHHVRSNFIAQFNLDEIDRTFCCKIKTSYWYGFLHSMAFLSIATPIAWTLGISNLMIASSFTKGRINVHCGSLITTDNEYKFATNGNTLHDGFELSRQDKIRILVEYQKKTKVPYFIQACSFNDHNCCECEKCFRTIVELVAEGADPKDFGFIIKGSITDYWKRIIDRDVALWGVAKEEYYYFIARERMKENYEKIKEKDFVDWFMNFDFRRAKKEGLYRYYRQNFFSIIKRKLHLKTKNNET